jgi:hypothetical protein
VADPLGKVNPGDGFVIRAATWNAFVDAARAHRKNEAGRAGAGLPTPDPLTPGCTVLVKNATGSTLPAWSTVKLGSPVVDAATYPYRVSDQPVFPATTPDGSDIPFAVTEEPIRDGKLGRAVVLGVAVADVSVSDSGHTYAAPAASSLVLASGTSGPCRIIWKESGTGTLKAVVLIDRTGGGDGAACEAAGCDGLVGLEEEWCLRMTLACHEGRFAEMGEDQFAAVFAWYDEVEEGWIFYFWDPEVPDWVEFEMDWGGGTGVPALTFATDGTPILTVGSLVMYYEPCATGGRFTGGPRNGFTGGTAPEPCEPNAFTVVVECSCCAIDGWQGDGWYCVLDTGEDCGDLENACVELREENGDHCDDGDAVTICSGPYATQEECEGACVTLGAAPSCTDAPASGVAATLYYRIDAPSGVAACADGQTGTMLEGTDTWSATGIGPLGCGSTNDMTLRCDVTYPDEWELSAATTFGGCGVLGGNVAASSGSASPFAVQFTVPACWFVDATGNESDTVTITISESPL